MPASLLLRAPCPYAWPQTLVCRRTLAGHLDDVLSLGGISVPIATLADDASLASLTSPGAGGVPGMSPVGTVLTATPSSPGGGSPMPLGSPRSGLERALLFVSGSADGTVRLWSGGYEGSVAGSALLQCCMSPHHQSRLP